MNETVIADLHALDIDSAELRWYATRDYLEEQRVIVTRQINAVFLIAEFLDRMEANAFRRGESPSCVDEPEFGCTCRRSAVLGLCDRFFAPKLIAADYLTARSLVVGAYKGKARERAIEILDPYMLPVLRKENSRARQG